MTDARPQRSVVIYDGQCPFCRRLVAFARRRDGRAQFEYIAFQEPGIVQRFPQLAGVDLGDSVRLIESDGNVLAGAAAVHGVLRRLRFWRHLAWIYRLPGGAWLAQRGYACVARHRGFLSKYVHD